MRYFKRVKKSIKHYIAKLKLMYAIKKLGVTKDDWIFMIHYGIGDTLFLSSLIDDFKLKNNGRVVLIAKESHKIAVKMFSGVDFYIPLDSKFKHLCLTKVCNSTMKRGEIFIPHPLSNHSLSGFESVVGYKNITLFDMYKMILKLDEKCEMKKPNSDIYEMDEAQKIFDQNAFDPEKTIVIFPHASSLAPIIHSFWSDLISKITDLNFNVIINSSDQIKFSDHKNVVQIDINLEKIVSVSLLASFVISIRSGVCDLLCLSDKKMIVLYPNDAGYKAFCLKNIFNHNRNLSEMVVGDSFNQDEIIKKIIS